MKDHMKDHIKDHMKDHVKSDMESDMESGTKGHDCCADGVTNPSCKSPAIFMWLGIIGVLVAVLGFLMWQANNPLPGFWK